MKALLIVDIENDFMSGGLLGVKGADELIPIINELIPKFSLVVAALDWHPENHCSFAAIHTGKKVGDEIVINGVKQLLWPVHCVQNTLGAQFPSALHHQKIAAIFHKGTDPQIDSYSAFFDNAHQRSTGLAEYLKKHHVTEVEIVGIATDYCVLYSALDAIDQGFKVTIITTACRGINLHPHDVQNALAAIAAKGGKVI